MGVSLREIADFAVAMLCGRISVTRRVCKASVSPEKVPGVFQDVIDWWDCYMSKGVPSIIQRKLMKLSI